MAPEGKNGNAAKDLDMESLRWGTDLLKRGFAKMQKGGVVMDVTDANQAAIAEEAGAVAVMALERVPADIRADGGVSRMSDPTKIIEIIDAVSIPVMAKCRIGHFAEAQILESLGVDMIDESEVLTPADPYFHVFKRDFTVPFVCGATELGEAVRVEQRRAAASRDSTDVDRDAVEIHDGGVDHVERKGRVREMHGDPPVGGRLLGDVVVAAAGYERRSQRGQIDRAQGVT